MKYKLSDICLITSSKRIFEREYIKNGIPFIRGQEVSDGSIENKNSKFECYISKERYEELKEKYNIPKKGDILITAVGTIGNLYYVNNDFEFYFKDGNLILFTNFSKNVYPKYLYYLMQSNNFKKQIEYAMIGAVQKALTIVMLSNINIDLPEYEEQIKIANIFSALDNKIKNNNIKISELENMSKVIYDYWFLQFEFPNEENKPYKTSGGKMVYNEILKREIPENWKVQNLKDNSLTQINIPGIEKFNSTKIYLATADVNKNNIIDGNRITFENRESRANMQPIKNSVWFAKMKNSIKHIFVAEYADILLNKYIFSTGFLGLKCQNNYSYEYICSFINTEYFEIFKDKIAHGATQEAVNNYDIKLIPIIIPSKEILLKYHETTKYIFKQIYLNNQENEQLKSLKDFLLPLLMNGQVTFKNYK